jgi:hypothetical protein
VTEPPGSVLVGSRVSPACSSEPVVSRSVREESPLEVALKGAVAGLAGTLVLTLAMQNAQRLMPRKDLGRTADAEADGGEQATSDPTEKLAAKVASGVFETELSPDVRHTLGMGIHWGYGAFWGMLYAVVQASLHLPTWLHSSILGLLVWAIGPMGLVPAMKLSNQATAKPVAQRLVSIALHQLYGWTAASTFHLLSRDA